MLTYDNEQLNTRYGQLKKNGVSISVAMGDTRESAVLDGICSHDKISNLIAMIYKKTGIHPSRQRLFAGGERMNTVAVLGKYFPTLSQVGNCRLELRCFIPLLISAQSCPGPMLTEIEVRPRNDELIIGIKRKIRDKFRIEIPQQRLHLHPAEMTTLSRRQELDNTRLLSCYLSPAEDGNFLEVLPHLPTPNSREIFIRIPMCITNAIEMEPTELKFPQQFHNSSAVSKEFLEINIPPPPPQTPEDDLFKEDLSPQQPDEDKEDWWLTIPLNLDDVIKRDPTADDVIKRDPTADDVIKRDPTADDVIKCLNRQVEKVMGSFGRIDSLKFATAKVALGGMELSGCMLGDSQVRSHEMLIYVDDVNLDVKMNKLPRWFRGKRGNPSAHPITPLYPLSSYREPGLRFTTPPNPIIMTWVIPPCAPLDLGANPGIFLEFTGVSYGRRYGSWDIPQHEKTYVDVTVEGTIDVCDVGLRSTILNSAHGESRLDYDVEVITNDITEVDSPRGFFYVHDVTEVTLLGPVNKTQVEARRNVPPYLPPTTWGSERRRKSEINNQLRVGRYGNPILPQPAPIRIRGDVSHLTSSEVDSVTSSHYCRRQFSETVPGQWYVSREKVDDVTTVGVETSGGKNLGNAFSTLCKRGTTIDGRPYVTVTYIRRCEVTSQQSIITPCTNFVDSFRKSLDFRIQTQFYNCSLLDSEATIPEAESFSLRVQQKVTRVEYAEHTPDVVTQFTSPTLGMEKIIGVNLPTARWRNANNIPDEPTSDLNK
uniref:uncharacterized protein LOC113475174 n=1 Tax=Ciona intestinalis TaxID=7719 RepID=UPI000EF4ACDD|nr:uncharacterized protein LOC113475174 [Ciona intestinalis]XP_026694763.1 uncharacterized protein LOC113475174 [Ciona intestinalis]|eukprot:XP_026694761.1 uncharacterized protein LOC113475174 [Ciona intestinalis]